MSPTNIRHYLQAEKEKMIVVVVVVGVVVIVVVVDYRAQYI